MNAQEITISLPYTTIAAKAWGDKTKPCMLAVHGWLDNAESFSALVPFLKDYYVIAIDLPGHGFSAHRPEGIFHLIDYVFDLLNVADALQLEKFDLLGHSLGGAIACTFAGSFSERLNHLLLIDALGPFAQAADAAPEQLRKSLLSLQRVDEKVLPTYPSIEAAAQARANTTHITYDAALLLAQRGTKRLENNEFTWRTDPRLTVPVPLMLTESQVVAFLTAITVPTILIHPNEGFPFPQEAQQKRRAQMKTLTLVEIEGRHHVHMEAPERVATPLLSFLKKS